MIDGDPNFSMLNFQSLGYSSSGNAHGTNTMFYNLLSVLFTKLFGVLRGFIF